MDFLGSTQAFMFSKGLVHIGKAFFHVPETWP